MLIKKIPFVPSFLRAFCVFALCWPLSSLADPTFNSTTGELNIPRIDADGITYNNVKLTFNLAAGAFSLDSFELGHIATLPTLLSGGQEVPAVSTAASGFGLMEVDLTSGAFKGGVMTQNLTGATAAHIHEGAAGTNGSVILALTLDEATGRFSVPANTVLTQEQLTALNEGRLYINVHTTTHPSGELRGQLNVNSRSGVMELLMSSSSSSPSMRK